MYRGQKHRYRVSLSGLHPKSEAFYRSVGGCVVLATGADRAKRLALLAERMTRPPSHGTGRVRAVAVVDLGHAGTDGNGCPICAGESIPAHLFTGAG